MSDHEISEDEQEINVLDTDSRLSHISGDSDCEQRSNCSTPNTDDRSSYNGGSGADHRTTVPNVQNVLPFSISNLLGKNFEQKVVASDQSSDQSSSDNQQICGQLNNNNSALSSIYQPFFNQRVAAAAGVLPGYVYTSQGGVLRVPAHRPLGGAGGGANNGGPGSPPNAAVFNPWALGLDPVNLQRSAAAAAFASQVVKDRLSGKCLDQC